MSQVAAETGAEVAMERETMEDERSAVRASMLRGGFKGWVGQLGVCDRADRPEWLTEGSVLRTRLSRREPTLASTLASSPPPG